MTAAAATEERMGIDEYARMPDDGYRTELVRGLVVREPQPGYRHGNIQLGLGSILRRHIRDAGLDLACVGPIGFVLRRKPPTVRGPDLAVLDSTRVPAPDHAGFVEGAPELAIEVLSPTNAPSQTEARVGEFLEAGARQVWVVDPVARNVVVHTSTSMARVFGPGEEVDGGDVMPALRIRVAEILQA